MSLGSIMLSEFNNLKMLKKFLNIKQKTFLYKDHYQSPFSFTMHFYCVTLFGLFRISDWFSSYSACQKYLENLISENI